MQHSRPPAGPAAPSPPPAALSASAHRAHVKLHPLSPAPPLCSRTRLSVPVNPVISRKLPPPSSLSWRPRFSLLPSATLSFSHNKLAFLCRFDCRSFPLSLSPPRALLTIP
ncbi:hypothetical protein PUN28_006039 [Cardiocondyla obscurior]|uniref:Uncharacterized protein n=1 Tax=Cardiocondyla obscurior TaxID=286306 RepID=A0AAW2GBT3_9HYME